VQYRVEDPSAVGFVPVVAPRCRLPEPGVSIGGIALTGVADDVRFFPGQALDVAADIARAAPFGGLAFAIVAVPRVLPDCGRRPPRSTSSSRC
jgi:hypothetical protein